MNDASKVIRVMDREISGALAEAARKVGKSTSVEERTKILNEVQAALLDNY